MTNLYKYYLEIKNRVLLLLVSWITTVLVSYIYKETILFLLVKPSMSYSNNITIYFIFTDVTEIFSVYIQIILFIGTHIIVFYTLYHLLLFLSLGLYRFEYHYLILIFKVGLLCFIFSIIIFNRLLLPISWQFFLSFQSFTLLKSIDLYFESKLNEYLTFYITSYYICVFYCLIFMVLIFFFEYMRTNLKNIKQFRKILYYIFIIFSTAITPPDIFSQLILSASLIIIYEILLWNLILKLSIQNLQHQPILAHKYTK